MVAVGKNKTSTVTTTKPKKLSLQEQMLQDALAASSNASIADSNVNNGVVSSTSLLDCDVGCQVNNTSSTASVFHNIVKKKQHVSCDEDGDDNMPFTDIANPCNRVVELD